MQDIPLEFFNDHLASEETERVTLRGPCGSWDATLQHRDDSVYLVQGWEDFVKGHSLGVLEFMVFLYNGSMSFDVNIYGKDGWQKNYDAPLPECAPSSTPPFPFFRHEMKSYNVGHNCSLVRCSWLDLRSRFLGGPSQAYCVFLQLIPKAFTRENLPKSRQLMVLRDSDGISWSTSISITSSGHLSLTGGWKDFKDAHSIKKGDACIFELVEQNLMKVSILRKGV